jgi:hypothetical protein
VRLDDRLGPILHSTRHPSPGAPVDGVRMTGR